MNKNRLSKTGSLLNDLHVTIRIEVREGQDEFSMSNRITRSVIERTLFGTADVSDRDVMLSVREQIGRLCDETLKPVEQDLLALNDAAQEHALTNAVADAALGGRATEPTTGQKAVE